jgi:hypothetical protein
VRSDAKRPEVASIAIELKPLIKMESGRGRFDISSSSIERSDKR